MSSFSVKQKIKGREADDVNKGKKIWQMNLVLFPQLSVFFKKCKSFSSFRWCMSRVSPENLCLLQVLLRNLKLSNSLSKNFSKERM